MTSENRRNFCRKRIVWISSVFLDRGMDLHKTSRMEILRHLAKRGHEAFLIALRSKDNNDNKVKDVHVISIPFRYKLYISSLMYALLLFLCLPFYLIYSKPDFIIVEPRDTTFFGLLSILLFPRSKRPKIVLDIRSPLVLSGYVRTLLYGSVISMAKKLVDGITFITPMMREQICDQFHIDSKSVGVWTDGASTTLFKPENYDGMTERKRLGLDHNFVIFFHGVFGKGRARGIPESIKSIEMLKSGYPDLTLFLLGTDPSLPEIKKLIQEGGVQDRVIIHDPVNYEDVPKYIALCDIGLVLLPDSPVWRYQCPLNLLEYLAMKKVVIATDIPANREVIGRSKCGIYVSALDPEQIAKAIVYAYDNKPMLKEWGCYGRSIVDEKYRWEKVAEDLEDYLLTL